MRMLSGSGRPIVYVITSGKATAEDFNEAADRILLQIQAAIEENVALVQIREKLLSGKQLYELTSMGSALTRGTSTKILLNDRIDIAVAAGADGVHLTGTSIPVAAIRKEFGDDLMIGVSVHSAEKALAASRDGADFALYGPVFETPDKGAAVGLGPLAQACSYVAPFPVIGLGGIDASNCSGVICAGAAGVAGIRSFADQEALRSIKTALGS